MSDDSKRERLSKEEYEERARTRLEREDDEMQMKKDARLTGTVIKRDALRPRDFRVDLQKDLGKYKVITSDTPLHGRGGFFCNVCDCLLRDSNTYLDHINGKKHQRALGMSMRVERVNVQKVRERLDKHKRGLIEGSTELSGKGDDVEERLEEFEREEEHRRQSRKRRKKEKKKQAKEAEKEEEEVEKTEVDPDMAAMGFDFQFGGSKKS
eukprot:387020_1